MENLLSIVTFMPALAALILAVFLRGNEPAAQKNAKWLALLATSLTFILSIFILAGFDPQDTAFQFIEQRDWIMGLQYKLGVDGISVLFVMLTTALMPISILACWANTTRVKDYMIAFLLLETLVLGAFMALDLVLFYLFFEAALIPMFLIIGIWGGAKRIFAAFKFFLYTLLGSVLMLIAIIVMYRNAGSMDIVALLNHQFASASITVLGFQITGGLQTMLWLAFFASFAVKMAIWPVHTWSADAHMQAPAAGSVILAAVLLNIGGYGFLRFSIAMFPIGSEVMASFVLWISAIAIIYASLVALVQEDMKKLVAYASVAHMGFVTMGIFSLNQQGIDGAIFKMISHGFISAALFLCIGVIYDRIRSHQIESYGGLAIGMPQYALVFMFFSMANLGLPGTSGFVGQFLILIGAFMVNTWMALLGASGLILSAAYGLRLYRCVVFGDLIKESLKSITDLNGREKAMFVPLVAITVLLGIYPALVLDIIGPSVTALIENYHAAIPVAETGAVIVTD